ncbi:hypothetical protein [Mesorhizobium sp. A623]
MAQHTTLTTDSDRKLRHLLRRGIRSGAFTWDMTMPPVVSSSKWLFDAVGCGRLHMKDVIEVTGEEFRRAHERMLDGDPCSYVVVGGHHELVHGWWAGMAGTPDYEIMRVASGKLERIEDARFRAFHGKDPDTRRTADFDVYRVLSGFCKAHAKSSPVTSRGFQVAHLPFLKPC